MTPQEIQRVESDIIDTLKNIYDPEIPVNIYDLGLVYDVDYTPDKKVHIRMTLTAPNCPMADFLVEEVIVEIVFDPPWDKNMMSEEALMELGWL